MMNNKLFKDMNKEMDWWISNGGKNLIMYADENEYNTLSDLERLSIEERCKRENTKIIIVPTCHIVTKETPWMNRESRRKAKKK